MAVTGTLIQAYHDITQQMPQPHRVGIIVVPRGHSLIDLVVFSCTSGKSSVMLAPSMTPTTSLGPTSESSLYAQPPKHSVRDEELFYVQRMDRTPLLTYVVRPFGGVLLAEFLCTPPADRQNYFVSTMSH